jgi:GIY-YIG domain-containing protein
MSGWTNWKKLATEHEWFDDDFDEYNGPACYELALGGPRGGELEIMYVGETKHEKTRIKQYARDGSHLSKEIGRELRAGWTLWYRAQAKSTKRLARAMQDHLLAKHDYPWNLLGQR